LTHLANLGHRVNGPHLVVGEHDGNDDGPVGHRVGQRACGFDAAVTLHVEQIGHLETLDFSSRLQVSSTALCSVFGGDDVVALGRLIEVGRALDGQVGRIPWRPRSKRFLVEPRHR
jgi:hypothetical protein